MNITTKLLSFREKIEGAGALNKEFSQLVGIELFRFIHSSNLLRDEFERRCWYLHNLVKDGEFLKIQNKLFDLISAVLKEIDLDEIVEAQKQWKNGLAVDFKNAEKDFFDSPFRELPEIRDLLLKKENYYMYGDDGSTSMDDIIWAPRREMVKKQYSVSFPTLCRAVSFFNSSKMESEPILSLLKKYDETYHDFYEKLYTVPILLHTLSFLNFFYFSAGVSPIKGHEIWYANGHRSPWERDNIYQLGKIKKDILTVIEDLIEAALGEETEKVTDKNLVQFDNTNGIIEYGKKRHAFQKRDDKALPLKLFRLLWKHRKSVRKGAIHKNGERKSNAYYAHQIGIIQEMSSYGKNKKIEAKFVSIVKGLTRITKKFSPLKLDTARGILLSEEIF